MIIYELLFLMITRANYNNKYNNYCCCRHADVKRETQLSGGGGLEAQILKSPPYSQLYCKGNGELTFSEFSAGHGAAA